MNRLSVGIVLALFPLAMLTSCSDRSEPKVSDARAAEWGQAAYALAGPLLEERFEYHAEPGGGLVIVLGENHASVRTQVQLAEILEQLLDKELIKAVLIEGSRGPVEAGDLSDSVLKVNEGSADSSEQYWRDMLESGRIAGYEYVALHRPSVEIQGVEDMAAKMQHALLLTERGDRDYLTFQRQVQDRGATNARETIKRIRGQSEARQIDEANALLADFVAASENYSTEVEGLEQARRPQIELQGELIRVQHRALDIYERLAEPYERVLPKNAEYESLVRRYNKKVEASQTLAVRSQTGSGTASDLVQAKQLQSELESLKPRIDRLESELKAFQRRYGDDLERLNELRGEIQRLNDKLEAVVRDFAPVQERFEEADAAAQDAYFLLVNHLIRIAPEAGVDPSPLRRFLSGERQRYEDEQAKASHRDELAERDEAMVRNTLAYMSDRNADVVVLIVGYAHVEGVTSELRKHNVSHMGGRISASTDEIEPWEEMAWALRRQSHDLIFAENSEIKELSRLLDQMWKPDQIARIRFFRRIDAPTKATRPVLEGLLGDTRAYEGVGGVKGRVAFVGKFPLDHNADFGAHVVDRGQVPGKPNENYLIVDRAKAEAIVREHSGNGIALVHYHRTLIDDEPRYRFLTADGELSFGEFQRRPPRQMGGGDSEYVVLIGEPDAIAEHGVVREPLWEQIRAGGGASGGGGGGKPPWTATLGAFDNGGRRRPNLLRSINAERAVGHVALIKRQKSSHIGRTLIIDATDPARVIDSLMFTPRRGDHAHAVVFVGRNTSALRTAIDAAGRAGLLENKQIGLMTCGDAFSDTAMLRESLLRNGAVLVWTPTRQIEPVAARTVIKHLEMMETNRPLDQLAPTIDRRIMEAIESVPETDPHSPALRELPAQSAPWVHHDAPDRFSRKTA